MLFAEKVTKKQNKERMRTFNINWIVIDLKNCQDCTSSKYLSESEEFGYRIGIAVEILTGYLSRNKIEDVEDTSFFATTFSQTQL